MALWLSTNIFVAGSLAREVLLLNSSVGSLAESRTPEFSGRQMPCSSARNRDTHIASFAACVRAIYSASVEDRATVCCLLLDQDTTDCIGSPCEGPPVRIHK